MNNDSIESHFTIYHSVSFSSQWSVKIKKKKRYKWIKEEKIQSSKQISIKMKKISEYKVQKRCVEKRLTQVKFPKDSSHELTVVKVLIPMFLLHSKFPDWKPFLLFKIKIKQSPGCPNQDHNVGFKHFYQNIRAYQRSKKICIGQWTNLVCPRWEFGGVATREKFCRCWKKLWKQYFQHLNWHLNLIILSALI